MTNRLKGLLFFGFIGFCILLFAAVVGMSAKSLNDTRAILTESIESQLLSIALAARDIVEPEVIRPYETQPGILRAARTSEFQRAVFKLRAFADSVNAERVYVIRPIGGEYCVVYDTDPVRPATGRAYVLSPVHIDAFAGRNASRAMSVVDESGSFNTAAVPVWYGDKIIAIVAANTSDELVRTYTSVARVNMILLVTALGATLLIMILLMYALLSRTRRIQDTLNRLAHYDALTNLPNRESLLSCLNDITREPAGTAFALFFVDLDNFKLVNDTAGHDAGDALLQSVGGYFQGAHERAKVFRPTPGGLNVAARIGGDEFIIVAPGIATAEDAARYADELIRDFRARDIDRRIDDYRIGLSIGAALYPAQTDNYHVLIKYADIAMYHAKRAGKNCRRVYEETMPGKDEK